MDGDRSTANKAASNLSKTVGKVNDRTKVILVKATGEGPQKVRTLAGPFSECVHRPDQVDL